MIGIFGEHMAKKDNIDVESLNKSLKALSEALNSARQNSEFFNKVIINLNKELSKNKVDLLRSTNKELRSLQQNYEAMGDFAARMENINQILSTQARAYNEKYANPKDPKTYKDVEELFSNPKVVNVVKNAIINLIEGTVGNVLSGRNYDSFVEKLFKGTDEIEADKIEDKSGVKGTKERRKEKIEEQKAITEEHKKQTKEIEKQAKVAKEIKIRPKRKRSTKQEVTEAIQETVKEEVKEAVKEGITEQQTLFNKDAFKIGSASSNIMSITPKKASTSLVPVAGTAMVPISGVTTRYSETTQRKMAYGERRKREFFRNHFNMPYRWDDPIKLGSARTEPLMLVSHTPEEVAEINNRINGVTLGSATDDTARKKRIQDRLYRNEQRNLKNLRGTGGAEPIMIGSARYNSENTFEAEQQREEDAKNRRKFVSDLATAILAAHKKNPIVDLLKYATLILGKHLPVLAAALITIAPLVGIFKGVRAMNTLRKAIVGGKGAGGVIKGVRGLRALKPSANLLAWFGLGPKALTTGVGRQLANGWNAGQGIGRIGTSLSYGFRAFTNQAKGFPVLNKVLPVTSKVWGSMKNAGQSVRAFTETSLKSGKIAPLLGSVFKKSFSGIGKVLLCGLKIGARGLLKGLLGPVMVGIDAISGFMATKGGRWWQRLFGILLKVLTLGFMSDKTIRKLVGMSESANEAAKQQNDDEERRHQERIGWWDRFWGWLKNILPWGKKDGVTNNAPKKLNNELEKKTNQIKKANEDIDKKLRTTYTKGTTDYAKRRGELYNQYIKANTEKGANKSIAQKLGFGERDPKLDAAAWAWADKKINDEAYQLKVQKTKNANEASRLTSAMNAVLPNNLSTEAKHGVKAVALGSLGLRGSIWSQNSVPYIAAANAGNLKALDNYLAGSGHKFTYTSAMGGHAVGTGHYKGNKIDFQTQGSVLTPAEYEQLFRLGYFGGNTGALGYERKNSKGKSIGTTPEEYKKLYNAGQVFMGGKTGNHYDFTVANGTETVEATKREQATSELRDGLAKLVGAKNKSDKQERTRNIVLSATDVTGSLGVWGITQLNNGVMRTGR